MLRKIRKNDPSGPAVPPKLYARVISPRQEQEESFKTIRIAAQIYPDRVADVQTQEAGVFQWDGVSTGSEVSAGQVLGRLIASEGSVSEIIAPCSGLIVVQPTEATIAVSGGEILFKIADDSEFTVRLAQRAKSMIGKGDYCELWSSGGFVSAAHVFGYRVAGRRCEMQLRLTGSSLTVAPGSRIELHGFQRIFQTRLYLPSSALQMARAGGRVGLLMPNLTLHFQHVELGAGNRNGIEVVKGLSSESKVVELYPEDTQEGVTVCPQ